MSKPKLSYFNGKGRAEVVRLIFAESKTDYVDNRVNEIGPLKKDLPFGQLPVVEVDGKVLAQSHAIWRFYAREKNLFGKTNWEGALIDMTIDGFSDLSAAHHKEHDDTKKKEEKEKWLHHLEKLLKTNHDGKGFFVGDSLSVADLVAFHVIDSYVDATLLSKYPLLAGLKERVATRPNIAAWLKSRPVTSF